MTFAAGQRLLASTLNTMPQLLGRTVLTGSQPSIPITIPTGFSHLHGVFTARQDSGSGGVWALMQFNGDSANDYTWQKLFAAAAITASSNAGALTSSINIGVIPGSGDTANCFATGEFAVGNITSAFDKTVTCQFQSPLSASSSYTGTAGGTWFSAATITSVALLPASGNLVAGSSMSIYGWS